VLGVIVIAVTVVVGALAGGAMMGAPLAVARMKAGRRWAIVGPGPAHDLARRSDSVMPAGGLLCAGNVMASGYAQAAS
jgi:hypothetical protein